MTLWGAIGEVLPELRREAEARMQDTIRFVIETKAYNPETDTTTTVVNVLFTTKCRVKVGSLGPRAVEVGGRTAAIVTREVSIPVNSAEVPTNAVGVITAVGPLTDPTLLGARLVIAGPMPGSQTTARRLQVSEVLT